MSKRFRQYSGILAAVIAYYFVHEGAHLVTALYYGAFRTIRFLGLGIQVDIYADTMTDTQLGIFCLSGAVSTCLFGWLLIALAKKICNAKSRIFKAAMWYVTLAILLIDPLYLSILCGFFGGGDMNGIKLLLPEPFARLLFGAVLAVNAVVFFRRILPVYKRAFEE